MCTYFHMDLLPMGQLCIGVYPPIAACFVGCSSLSFLGGSYRYTNSKALQAYKETGHMQFSEFGTNIPTGKNIWNIVKDQLGMGEGTSFTCSQCHLLVL